MKISHVSQNSNITSFGAAVVNINAFSDTHGNLYEANSALEELRKRRRDVFCPEKKGNANVMAVCGDWFMNGAKTGYLSNPDKPLCFFQLDIFNKFIEEVKKISGKTLTLFTPGNHEFDGGIPLMDNVLSEIDSDVLMTNLDVENSPALSKSIDADKIVNEKILEVEDDKNPNLIHKVLFLGISPVNMPAYQSNLDGISMTDSVNKRQKYVEEKDYQQTMDLCKDKINKFKQDNPNGIVVLLCHTGVEFADNLAKESQVDLVFDGHEHKIKNRKANDIDIVTLSQNFMKMVNAKIYIDDDGKLQDININTFSPLNNKTKGPVLKLYKKLFSKDLAKKYVIRARNKDFKTLDIDNIRCGNNFLANFITDGVLEEIKKINPEVNFFALNSSSIRHELSASPKNPNSPFDVLNVLNGIREDEAQVMLTKVSGKELAYMVLDNYLFNRENPEQNSIIHYSGLIVDRTEMLKAYEKGVPVEQLTKYIVDKAAKLPIEPNKVYTIANAEKYFDKSLNPKLKAYKKSSQYLGRNVHELLLQYFDQSKGNLYAECDIRIK